MGPGIPDINKAFEKRTAGRLFRLGGRTAQMSSFNDIGITGGFGVGKGAKGLSYGLGFAESKLGSLAMNKMGKKGMGIAAGAAVAFGGYNMLFNGGLGGFSGMVGGAGIGMGIGMYAAKSASKMGKLGVRGAAIGAAVGLIGGSLLASNRGYNNFPAMGR